MTKMINMVMVKMKMIILTGWWSEVSGKEVPGVLASTCLLSNVS